MPADKPRKVATAGRKRFRMDTRKFVELWKKAISDPLGTGTRVLDENDWRTFVLSCFALFSTQPHNQEVLATDPEFQNSGTDAEYLYLSDRCYSKCTTIRRRLRKIGNDVALPHGYRNRPGTGGGPSRITINEIASLFNG